MLMRLFKVFIGAALIAVQGIALAASLSLAGMSSEGIWSKAYEKYGYNTAFESEFLKAVGEQDGNRIYHLGAGTVICSSLENAKKFYEHSKANGSSQVVNNSSNAYPACFQPYLLNVVAFQSASAATGGKTYINYKFVMTKQPSWRFRFFNNKIGDYALYEGWTVTDFEVNKLHWKKFVVNDMKNHHGKNARIKTINNLPDDHGNYPLP